MHRWLMTLLLVAISMATAPRLSASGSVPSPRASTRESFSRFNAHTETQSASTSQSKVLVADEPYNLGKELFAGRYKFGSPQLSDANIAEKKLRLVSVRNALPAAERANLKPAELSKRLTNQEMNALEYYIGVRFGKVITKAPSWAKQEPRPQLASASAQ